jgi:hypothetical protein
LPALKQRVTPNEFERRWAASHVLRRVGNVVEPLEEAVLRVDEPNITKLHITRAVQGSSVFQSGKLLDVQTVVGSRRGGNGLCRPVVV